MAGLFGGGAQPISNTAPRIGALNVQTSAFGMAIPLVYGQTRISANLIWYGDFTAIPHTQTQSSGGKGGGGVESSNTTFTYTTAVAMGLGEGVYSGINTVWADKDVSNMSALGLSLFTGTKPQTPWGYLTTNHPTQALGYQSLAYVASPAYDLGSSANLPNHTFEVLALYNYSPVTGIHGAKPDVIVNDYLTSTQYGAGFNSANIPSMTQYASYCLAAGILLSPAYTSQAAANTHIDELMQATNSAVVWSEGQLKILPYGDTAISGAWGSYTPNNTVLYDLNDDDFLGDSSSDPIIVERKTQADAFNRVQVEFKDSANQYNVDIEFANDLANIDTYGLRPMSVVQLHCITHRAVAQIVAQFILQRALYIRNTYHFTLGMRYCLLEPMDIVTITDVALGLNKYPVRITDIEETTDGRFNIIAEEFLAGVSHADTYPSQTSSGYQTNYNVAPGNANAPVVFEPPTTLSVTPQIWLATSGGDFWGGAEVWVSRDNTSYLQVGIIHGGARHGLTTAALALGSDPDTTNTLAVDLTISKGDLVGGTLADRDNMATLSYVDGELISYQTANLTALHKYNLSSMRRGAYGTAKAAHLSGKKFARLDQAIFKYDYDPSMIGSPLYIKLRSFNIYGLQREDLAGLTPITYNVTGASLGSITGLALAQPWVGKSVKVKWNAYVGANTYKIDIFRSGALKRTITGIANTNYEYTYEDMVADGGPWRSIDINLYAVSSNGASSAAAVLTVSNPQIATPAGSNATAGSLSITVSATKPTDTDWAGFLIYGSTTSGFTPGSGNLLFDGQDNSHTFTGLSAGVPFYYRLAHYDSYGQDSLNFSSEITATPLANGGVRIVSAIPSTSGATDGDVVSYTVDHKLYRFNSTAVAWQTWVDGTDILASSITTGKLATNSVQAANINAGAVDASKINVTSLSSIQSALGVITAGNITLGSNGYIKQGMTAYATGSGFWQGDVSGTPKFSMGVGASGSMSSGFAFDGTNFNVYGQLIATGNVISNAITNTANVYSSGTLTLNGSYQVSQSCSITSTGGTVFFLFTASDVVECAGSSASNKITYQLYVDGALIKTVDSSSVYTDSVLTQRGSSCPAISYIHTPAAGGHTYTVYALEVNSTKNAYVNNPSILLIELKK